MSDGYPDDIRARIESLPDVSITLNGVFPFPVSKHSPCEVCDCHTDRTKHCAVCAEYGDTCECAAKAGE
jgi:hypothetical protein